MGNDGAEEPEQGVNIDNGLRGKEHCLADRGFGSVGKVSSLLDRCPGSAGRLLNVRPQRRMPEACPDRGGAFWMGQIRMAEAVLEVLDTFRWRVEGSGGLAGFRCRGRAFVSFRLGPLFF